MKDPGQTPPRGVSGARGAKHNLQCRGVGNTTNLLEKRDSRVAGGHNNRVQISECLMVYGQLLMLLLRNITAFPLALIFIFSFITHCITGFF